MSIDHATLVSFAKSFGLFYLIAMSIVAVAYAFWPSKQAQFNQSAADIIDDEDTPCR